MKLSLFLSLISFFLLFNYLFSITLISKNILRSSSSSWGYQSIGISLYLTIDNYENSLYSISKYQTKLPFSYYYFSDDYNYLITKLNLNGFEKWKYQILKKNNFEPKKICFNNNSLYIIGYNEQIIINKINKENGILIWEKENYNIIKNESIYWIRVIDCIIDNNENLYLLYQYEYRSQYHKTTNRLIRLDGRLGSIISDVELLTNNSQPFQSYSPIFEQSLTSPKEFYIKGHQYFDSKIPELYFMNIMSFETGQVLSTVKIDPFNIPSTKYELTYKKNTYFMRDTKRHEYGTNKSVIIGYIINKNYCKEGHYYAPNTITTSIATPCPGFSWSLPKPFYRQLVCTYYYGRVNTIGIILIYIIPILFVFYFSYKYEFPAVHILSSILGSLVFSTDISYLFSKVYYNLLLFVLSWVFNFLPIIHLFEYTRQVKKDRQSKYLITPPAYRAPFIVLSSRDEGAPYFRNIRCTPRSIHPSEDFLLLVGGWIIACFAQLFYSFFWILFHIILMIPWLIIHIPWFIIIYLWGYILYRTGLLHHQVIKENWYALLFYPPSSKTILLSSSELISNNIDNIDNIDDLEESKMNLSGKEEKKIEERKVNNNNNNIDMNNNIDIVSDENNEVIGFNTRPNLNKNDISWQFIISSILILFVGLIGVLIIQHFNDKRMKSNGILSKISIITKSLFIVNIFNRIAVVYGPIIIPFIRMKCSYLFPSLSFVPLAIQDQSQIEVATLYLNKINQLENDIQALQSQLLIYQERERLNQKLNELDNSNVSIRDLELQNLTNHYHGHQNLDSHKLN